MIITIPKIGEIDVKAKCVICCLIIAMNGETVAGQEGVDKDIIKRLPTTVCKTCQPKV